MVWPPLLLAVVLRQSPAAFVSQIRDLFGTLRFLELLALSSCGCYLVLLWWHGSKNGRHGRVPGKVRLRVGRDCSARRLKREGYFPGGRLVGRHAHCFPGSGQYWPKLWIASTSSAFFGQVDSGKLRIGRLFGGHSGLIAQCQLSSLTDLYCPIRRWLLARDCHFASGDHNCLETDTGPEKRSET